MTWFGVLKNQGLVNLPKFKVKPFNVNKPEEEETRCKDKIMEVYNTAYRFQPPTEILEDYGAYEEGGTSQVIWYHDEDRRKHIQLVQNVHKSDVDVLPEEAFCRLLDVLQKTSKPLPTVRQNYIDNFYLEGKMYAIYYDNFLTRYGFSQYFHLTSRDADAYITVELSLIMSPHHMTDAPLNNTITETLSDVVESMEWSV